MIKLYSDRTYASPHYNWVPLLIPLMTASYNISNGPYERFIQNYSLASIDRADFAVFPIDYGEAVTQKEGREKLNIFLKETEKKGIKRIFFFYCDSDKPLNIDNSIIFRPSIKASLRSQNELAVPAWTRDLLEEYNQGKMIIQKKGDNPHVGFVGYAATTNRKIISKLYHSFIKKPHTKGDISTARNRALKTLKKSPGIICNFTYRKSFWGLVADEKVKEKQKIEFFRNIIDNDYTLCARGGGNFSYRLYETLCCGRIPVFINTDCVLPFQDSIDWKRYCVWVEEKEIKDIGKILLDFHKNQLDHDFISLQYNCRSLWVNYLSFESYFVRMHDILAGLL